MSAKNHILKNNRTKKVVTDFIQENRPQTVFTDGEAMERVPRAPVSEDFSWATHTSTVDRRAQQHHYFQRKLRGARLLQNPVANVSWSLRHSGGQLPPGPDGSAGGHQDGPDSCSVTVRFPE